jgi:predicted metal-dependent hydrolase
MRRRHSDPKRHEFRQRVLTWAERIKVEPRVLRIQKMSRKWASCSTAGYLSFSESILEQPVAFQNYVIVHELLHLRVPNHGKLFKSLLTAYCPGWKAFA